MTETDGPKRQSHPTAYLDERQLTRARQLRLGRVRTAMMELGIDAVVLTLGADMPWCIGYEALATERPTVLVVPSDGGATLVVPALEAPRVHNEPDLFSLRPWGDYEDCLDVVAHLLHPHGRIALSDRTWGSVVIGLQQRVPDASFCRGSDVMAPLRAVKDSSEMAALRAAGHAADEVSTALISGAIPLIGRTEQDVAREIVDRLLAAGHSRVGPPVVASGPNAASPHHTASDRTILVGEPVVCDFGGTVSIGYGAEYWSDTTRTVCTGRPSGELREVYQLVQEAQHLAVGAVRTGVPCQDIDRAARSVVEAAGYGQFFLHRTGHGIGMEGHEDPYIVEGNGTALRSGHAFSIEPGIYLPGRGGVRIEDIVLLDGNDVVSCNTTDRGLHLVEV